MNADGATGRLVMQAPAKVNLFFEVLAKRADGFHEIETLMCPIHWFDTLSFQSDPSGQISLECKWASGLVSPRDDAAGRTEGFGDLPRGDQNIVTRALQLLRERAGIELGASVELLKRIPSEAGLGGGSSDAAAALILANRGWNLNWPRERLMELAAALGSDVPFFLLGGPALCTGRGEKISPVGRLQPLHLVVVRPPVGMSTPAVYRACTVPTQQKSVEPLVAALQQRSTARPSVLLQELMHNGLQAAAETLSPWIGRLGEEFARTAALAHQMSGSGSSYFGLYRDARQARRVAAMLRARNIGRVYAVAA